jgi:hypothetical protein
MIQRSLAAFFIALLMISRVAHGQDSGLTMDDFVFNDTHIQAVAAQSRLYRAPALLALADYYRHDEGGQRAFRGLCARTIRILRAGDYPPSTNYDDEIYRVNPTPLALVYFLTGHAGTGAFLHDNLLSVMAKPLPFWLHAERFPKTVATQTASLQSGSLMSRVVPALDFCRQLFTAEEQEHINAALREKGLQPGLRFCEGKNNNNWLAVVASGTHLAARFLQDAAAHEQTLAVLQGYLDSTLEEDGSYGEGAQYLLYPVGELIGPAAAMTPTERARVFRNSSLGLAPDWLAYGHTFATFEQSKIRMLFHDGGQFVGAGGNELAFLAALTGSGRAVELHRRLGGSSNSNNWKYRILSHDLALAAAPRALEELPLVRSFANGECFIRSGWAAGDQVLAMLSGGRTRVGFSHNRAYRNGIALAAFGEYLLVNPGHSSYRGAMRREWDMLTRSGNTITIDGKSQLFPSKSRQAQHVEGEPRAVPLLAVAGELVDVLSSEAAGCYQPAMGSVRRTVIFVRQAGYWLVWDRLQGEEAHDYDSFWHVHNLDGQSELSALALNSWLLRRPLADMAIHCLSSVPLRAQINPSIMHRRYAYNPGGEGEGRLGSALELQVAPAEKQRDWELITLLAPAAKGQLRELKAQLADGQVIISGDEHKAQFILAEQGLDISINGRSEHIAIPADK